MARTAPAPNVLPIPGMCPGVAILGGGSDGGGGRGGGTGLGGGGAGGGGGVGGEDAGEDARGAPDYERYPECGYASHPVDVVTGRAFTHPIVDLALPGPLPLTFARMYSSKAADRDAGLGFGWAHSFGWEIEIHRRRITIWNEQGIAVDFELMAEKTERIGPWGWWLRHEPWGFLLDVDDDVQRRFELAADGGTKYLLTAVVDRNGNRIALQRDQRDGRLSEIVDSAGRRILVPSTREGRIAGIEVLDPGGSGGWRAVAAYVYSDAGDLIEVTDGDGFVWRYAYDVLHLLTEDTDRTGLTFHFRYDDKRRCVESWGDYPGRGDPSLMGPLPRHLHDKTTPAKGIHHCKFELYDDGYSEVVDSTQVRRFEGTRHGTLSKSVEGGGVLTAAYREDGHLIARTDPMGATTTFDRDARGRVTRIADALNAVTEIERDGAGLPVRMVDPAGGMTTIERDGRGNPVLVVDAAGGVTSFRYDKRGLVTEVIDACEGRMLYEHDDQGNCIAIMGPTGAAWRFCYDGLGRLVAEIDPLGAATTYAYSIRGDLLAMRDAAGGVTRWKVDGEHHLTEIVSPLGHITRFTWGGYHRLCSRTDANGDTVRLGYDVEGQLVRVVNEVGEVHDLRRDSSGNLIGEKTFDGREVRYRNDLNGRLLRMTTPAGWMDLEYDLAGRMVQRELSDGAVDCFEHDALGNLVSVRGAWGEVTFERDAVGRIVREVQRVSEEEHSVESRYDRVGNRVLRRTSLGHVEEAERDAAGERRRTVLDGTHVVEHVRDALGQELARALPGGGRIESMHDPMGRLWRRRVLGRPKAPSVGPGEPPWVGPLSPNVLVETAYRYDGDGEVVWSWDLRRGTTEYRYDPAGQLLAVLRQQGKTELFRVDPAGNVHEDGPGAPVREHGPGNVLLRRGDATYEWDREGRLIRRIERNPDPDTERAWVFAWSAGGALTSVTAPDGTVTELSYDSFGRRVLKRVLTPPSPGLFPVLVAEVRFVWDGDVLVHKIRRSFGEDEAAPVKTRTYCFEDGGFMPFAERVNDGAWLHHAPDLIGTPVRIVRSDGTVAGDARRFAWEMLVEGDEATAIRFPGQCEDPETGLWCSWFRYYDPATGRFISADPIGLLGGPNAFIYPTNPVRSSDPYGLDWNYRLREIGARSGFYVGRASDKQTPADVVSRHRNRTVGTDGGRFQYGRDQLEVITPPGTPSAVVRGIEELGILSEGTNIGRRRCNGNRVRGNNIAGISQKNGGRVPYLAAGRSLLGKLGVTSAANLTCIGGPYRPKR